VRTFEPTPTGRDFGLLIPVVPQGIEADHSPDGYNIGANIGVTAGQTVSHAVQYRVTARAKQKRINACRWSVLYLRRTLARRISPRWSGLLHSASLPGVS
jgi:hypothetical protein